MHLTIDLYIYSFQLFAIKLEPVNFQQCYFSTLLYQSTEVLSYFCELKPLQGLGFNSQNGYAILCFGIKNFIELCLIVNSYKEWVLNLSDCFYKSICKANYIALPTAKVKSLI